MLLLAWPHAGGAMGTSYRFGIKEKYFLADATTRGTPRRTVKAFHDAVRTRLPRVEREMLQSQVEVSTPPQPQAAPTARGKADAGGGPDLCPDRSAVRRVAVCRVALRQRACSGDRRLRPAGQGRPSMMGCLVQQA